MKNYLAVFVFLQRSVLSTSNYCFMAWLYHSWRSFEEKNILTKQIIAQLPFLGFLPTIKAFIIFQPETIPYRLDSEAQQPSRKFPLRVQYHKIIDIYFPCPFAGIPSITILNTRLLRLLPSAMKYFHQLSLHSVLTVTH